MAKKKTSEKKNKKAKKVVEEQGEVTVAEIEVETTEVLSNDENETTNDESTEDSEIVMEEDSSNDGQDLIIASEEESSDEEAIEADVEGTELGDFESANIEDLEVIEEEQLDSIIESMLFATDKSISIATFRNTFKGTTVKSEHIRKSLKRLEIELAGGRRGVMLEEVQGGWQIRTKLDNLKFLTRSVKPRFFKVSGPALEVLAIVAYKQPTVKAEIDEIRGVESGHLLRALMEKGLVSFEGKSDLPGKPMLYGTTKKFLEIFGLRNLRELPTLSQIDELLPEGIGEDENDKPKLADITDSMSTEVGVAYSEGEEELNQITDQLQAVALTTDFFEQEKLRQKKAREAERARDIREALLVGENVPKRDRNWLERYDLALQAGTDFVDEKPAGASVADPEAKPVAEAKVETAEGQASVGSLAGAAASAFAESGFADESESGRFEEEEDRSLDGDLNVDLHDEE